MRSFLSQSLVSPTHTQLNACALALLVGFTTSACSLTSKTVVKDIAQQNVAVESPNIPHLQGASLKPEQTRIQGEYRYAGPNSPALPIAKDNNTEGHANITHAFYGQLARTLGDGETGWEVGFFGGGAVSMSSARVQNTSRAQDELEDVSAPFLKLGVGFRGPLVRHARFSVGLNLEAEASRQAYRVDLYRVKTTETTVEFREDLFGGNTPESSTATTQSSERLVLEDHIYAFTPRAGLYGDVTILPELHLILGLSAQLSKRFSGYAEESCEYEFSSDTDILAFSDSDPCDPKDTFPMGSYQAYLTYYGGLSLNLTPLSLNLIASSSAALAREVHAPVPFQLTGSVGLTF
jgi:hypothetical protein